MVLPDAAYGTLFLGKNNQALQQQYSYRMDVTAPGAIAIVTVQKVMQYVDADLRRHDHEAAEPDVPDVRSQEAPVDGQGRPVVNGVVK